MMRSYRYNNSLVNQHSMTYASLGLVGITLLSASLLTSSFTSATNDPVVDEINITVPNGIVVISDSAFENCENIISVKLPDSVCWI